MAFLYNKFIGGQTIQQAIHTSKSFKWTPIYDYAREGVTSARQVEQITKHIIDDLHTINTTHQHPNKPFYALKLSTFIAHPKSIAQLNTVVQKAHTLKIPILLDAEDNSFHAKEVKAANVLARTYNHEDTPPSIFKTYQMYRKDAFHELEYDLEQSHFNGFKLVRGAYLAKDKRTGVLHRNKTLVDYSYDRGVEMVFDHIRKHPNAKLLVATHNTVSVKKALKLVRKHDGSSSQVSFAQLKGMADPLTNHILETSSCNVYKYVPYGSFTESLPYLLRRVGENYDILKYIM